ncbi:hypothetical protein [Pseudomonas taeanensis]|jgi:hypothetical protein|nr:hypothetical protein [Pseudomonas taeanensis]
MPLLKLIRQNTPCASPLQALAVSLSRTAWFQHNGLLASKTSHVITTGRR